MSVSAEPRGSRSPSDEPDLRDEIMRLRRVDNVTNLGYLALDYGCLIATIAGAIVFAERRAGWGLARGWNVPVFGLAIVLIGALQHRLSGLAHEASHFSLFKNKLANDLAADVLCLFPIFATIHFYRLFHLAHHQHTNDPERDPDLVNLGTPKRVKDFPMPRLRAVITIYFRAIVLPISFVHYTLEYIYINGLGKGGNVLMRRVPGGDADSSGPRVGTVLGFAYAVAYNLALWQLTRRGLHGWIPAAAGAGMAIVGVVAAILPDRWLFRSPFRQPYSPRVGGVIRLGYYTAVFGILSYIRGVTQGRSAIYPVVLWWVPMSTTFMFFMLLRDIYQHTNADDGRLTNTRVFFTDPITRWAVLIHGQDMHVPHHLFPAIPHYRLRSLHRLLRRGHADYATQVVECRGTFANAGDAPTILDVLTQTKPPREG